MTIGISACAMVHVPSYLTTIRVVIINRIGCTYHQTTVASISFPYCSTAKMSTNQTTTTETSYKCHPIRSLRETQDMMHDSTNKTTQVNTRRALSMNRQPARAQQWTTPRSSWTTPSICTATATIRLLTWLQLRGGHFSIMNCSTSFRRE